MSAYPRKQFPIKKKHNLALYSVATALTVACGIGWQNKGALEESYARYFPQKNHSLGIEPILQERRFVPEEFYTKMFGSDGFLPVRYIDSCKPLTCEKDFESFLHLDGAWHEADLYLFALQGVSSGHRPHNRKEVVKADNDRHVTWLDAIHTLTKLHPENTDDQEIIQAWITANYSRIFQDGRTLDPEHISFKEEQGKIVDILYDGRNDDASYTVWEYSSGAYRSDDRAWMPSRKKSVKHKVVDSTQHLVLPATAEEKEMLLIPDYLLRDNIETINAGVRISPNRSSKYRVRVEEIGAELEAIAENDKRGMGDPFKEMIITPTLDLIVSDIIQGNPVPAERFNALVGSIRAENYSDSQFNSPPLVTFISGGQCGATAGQFATMLYLAGIKDFHPVHFPKINHVGLYGPLEPGLPLVPQLGQYDKYWYVETTNGQVGVIGEFMPSYGETVVDVKVHTPVDLRPQLAHLKSAEILAERKGKH